MRRTLDRLQAARREDRGFTLIELLIVIIILGILAAIVVFSVRGITDRGDTNACKTAVATINTAIEADYALFPADPVGTIGELVQDGVLKADGTYTTSTGTTVTVGSKTITLTPGDATTTAVATATC